MTLFWIIMGIIVVAIIYKHQKDKKKQPKEEVQSPIEIPGSSLKSKVKLIHIVGAIIGVILLIYFWYIVVPVFVIVLVWEKTNLEKRKKWQATTCLLIAMVVLSSITFYLNRPPSITILEPEDNIVVYTPKVTIKGLVTPKGAQLEINDLEKKTDDGNFSHFLDLREGKNIVRIKAETWFTKETSLTINRELTEEEIAAKEKAKAEAKARAEEMAEKRRKEAAAEAAKAKAEQEAWEQSKAGQICKAHPEWDKESCEKLANNKIWIGMTYDMLVYRRGKPDSKNVSNYGWGNEYQYCWWDWTPSCFYDKNGDGIIDSYN